MLMQIYRKARVIISRLIITFHFQYTMYKSLFKRKDTITRQICNLKKNWKGTVRIYVIFKNKGLFFALTIQLKFQNCKGHQSIITNSSSQLQRKSSSQLDNMCAHTCTHTNTWTCALSYFQQRTIHIHKGKGYRQMLNGEQLHSSCKQSSISLQSSALRPDNLCTTTPKTKAEESTEVLKSHANGSEQWVHLQVQ